MTPPPNQNPKQPPARRGRWLRKFTFLLFLFGLEGAGGWRYRVTRLEYRLARGQDAIRAGDAEKVRDYADRLEAAGYTDQAHLLRGEALLSLGSPGMALDQLNKVASEGPIRLRAAALSGRCLLQLGDLREAHRVFSFVIAEQPDHADGHRGLAAIAYDLGQLGEAVLHLGRVAELDPRDYRPHRLIGLIYKDMARDGDAEEAYRESLRRDPPPAAARELRLALAEVLARQTKFADGLAILGELELIAAGEDPNPVALRAECLRGLGRIREAADVLDAALPRYPSAVLFRLRGQVHQDSVQLPEAVKSLERSVELDPNEYQSHYLLGQAYSGAGRVEDAGRAFARVDALKKNLDRITALSKEAMEKPWDPKVRLELAKLSDDMGKPNLAQMWRKAADACAER